MIPLWRHSCILKEYWEELKDEFDTLLVNEVKEEDKPLLLGGIIQKDKLDYTINSLAEFYAKFFGMRLKDIQSWILQSQTGERLTEINVEVVKTGFIKFVNEIFKLLDDGLYQQQITEFEEPERNYEELRNDPNKVRELIKNFYQGIQNISLNYNYGTFFLCSINQITYRYMKAAYPRVDKEILDFLRDEFGLTELKWNNPINPKSKTFSDYTIYCFPEYNPNNKGKSFGGAICTLNERIWSAFSDSSEIKNTLDILFRNIPNFKEKFGERIKNRLPERHYSSIYFKGITASESYSVEVGNKTIMGMLDENSPFLFTNQIEINGVTDIAFTFISVG